jgi:hypothetical protein
MSKMLHVSVHFRSYRSIDNGRYLTRHGLLNLLQQYNLTPHDFAEAMAAMVSGGGPPQ